MKFFVTNRQSKKNMSCRIMKKCCLKPSNFFLLTWKLIYTLIYIYIIFIFKYINTQYIKKILYIYI